jgi:hypothetical protein
VGGTVAVPVLQYLQVPIDQKSLASHFGNWHPGPFGEIFADLAQASGQFGETTLEDFKKHLSDEASKGTEVFEAFGLKFPAGQVTLWGIILLLGIEIYFLAYLRQWAEKLGPDDSGWEVPWIGMDTSKLSQSIFFVTLVPLPVVALTFLAVRRATALFVSPSDKNRHLLALLRSLNWSGRAEILVLLLASISSLAPALLCWKYRPRLPESAEVLTHREQHWQGAAVSRTSESTFGGSKGGLIVW